MLQKLHYWIGALGIAVFLLTGQYMDIYHNHLVDMADAPRMIYRSSHIYLLMASVINLAVALNFSPHKNGFGQKLQLIMSILVIVSPVLLLTGFFVEPSLSAFNRPYSRLALYALFGAGMLMTVLSVNQKEGEAAGN